VVLVVVLPWLLPEDTRPRTLQDPAVICQRDDMRNMRLICTSDGQEILALMLVGAPLLAPSMLLLHEKPTLGGVPGVGVHVPPCPSHRDVP